MIRVAFFIFLLLATPSLSQTVRVSSGEHQGFTRLVLEFGREANWQVGRSTDGYVLRVAGGSPLYDLTKVFAIIGKTRLAAIAQDGPGSDLRFSLGCACHAAPFEFRPGIVVLDLKDGPPPKGSSFELALDDPATTPPPLTRPRARPAPAAPTSVAYDWKTDVYQTLGSSDPQAASAGNPTANALLPPDPGLQTLRATLLRQMARGASQGMVELVKPQNNEIGKGGAGFASAQIRIGPAPVGVTQPDRSVQGDLGAKGTVCLSPESLAIADWADSEIPVSAQMADMRLGLSGEFDRTEPEQVVRFIRFLLYAGFGVEARQMIAAFQPDHPDRAVWQALGHLLDEEPDPSATFKDQAGCSGPVAMWALLADDTPAEGDPLDEGAVKLAFSQLPRHLRRHLGPRLADRLLAIGLSDAARAIGDAILRAPGTPGAAVELMGANLDLQTGNPAAAERIAATLADEPGPNQPEAMIALVEAKTARLQPVESELALSLRAMLAEHQGTDLAPRLQEALTLAEAASGNFSAAFTEMTGPRAPTGGIEEEIWSLLVALAPDGDFLAHSVIAKGTAPPTLPDELIAEIARRLVALGLADSALQWLGENPQADPILLAEASLRRNDGRAAMKHLAGVEDDVSVALKLQALERLGQESLRAQILVDMQQGLAASAALARAGDWQRLATMGEEPWQAVASLAQMPTDLPADGGPLARGHVLAAAAPDTAAAIAALLEAIPTP